MTTPRCSTLLALLLLAACPPPKPPPTLPLGGAIGSPLGDWIPADVALAVAVDGSSVAELSELLAALGLDGAGALGAMGARETAAWRAAGIEPTGGVWMMLDVEAGVTARCALVGPAGPAAEALVAAGGTARTAEGARLVDLDDVVIVIEHGGACAVGGGARSRVERAALKLAALTAEDRLVARQDARAQLAQLPAAPLVAWAPSDAVDAVLAGTGLPVGMLDTARAAALALEVDVSGRVELTVIAPPGAAAPPDGPAPVAPGAIVRGPAPTELPVAPALPPEDNPDVPRSAEHEAAAAALAEVLAAAEALAEQVRAADRAARAAWIQAWGIGEARVTATGSVPAAVELAVEWRAPAWPPAALRAAAQAAAEAAVAEVPAWLAARAALLDDARARLDALVKLRARDVAAWDRAHR